MSKQNRKKIILADLSLIVAAFFWGGGFVAVKDAVSSIAPFYMITIRFGVASLLLTMVFWKRFRKIKRQDIKIGVLVGIFLFLAFAAQTVGAQYTEAGKQAFLTAVNVVIVPFLTWILYKNKLDMYSIIASILCFIGIGFLTLKDGLSINIGDALTLLCALLFAIHITLLGRYAKMVDSIVLTIIQMATTSVMALPWALFFEPLPQNLPKSIYVSMTYMIIFSSMLGFLIQTIAQKYTTPSHTSMMLCFEAVFGSVLAVIFLGDVFTPGMIIGCLLIFVGIIIAETKMKFLETNNSGAESDKVEKLKLKTIRGVSKL